VIANRRIATVEGVVARHHDVAELSSEWEALAEAVGAPPFLRPGWFAAWYAAFGRGRTEIYSLRRDGQLAAVLPLERRAGALLAAANWHTPLFGPVAADEGALAALCGALLGVHVARLDLLLLDAGDPAVSTLRELAPHSIERVVTQPPYVDATGSWADYDAGLPRKQRKELRRWRRRLDEEGTVEVEFTAGGDRLDALLDEGFEVEGSGWKAEAGTAIVSDPTVERFYRDVAHWADAHGWLTLAFLRLDGRAIAFDLCLEAGDAVYALKGGLVPEYRRHGPGHLLAHASLARAFASERIASYEFLGDADDYKLIWSDAVRERVRVQAFRHSPAGLAELLAWSYGRRAAKRVAGAIGRKRS